MWSRILNKCYYLATGLQVGELQKENSNWKKLLASFDARTAHINVHSIEEVYGRSGISKACEELAALYKEYGSDKSTKHDYHLIYGSLLEGKRDEEINVLEIGLGTNDTRIASHMRGIGHPGGSLRAVRKWAPKSDLYGADIDTNILFSEERIHTYYVNQLVPDTLRELRVRLSGKKFDLIIDDGLHTPLANLNTLNELLPLLKKDGHFVVEDIRDSFLPIFKIIAMTLSPKYTSKLIRARKENVMVVALP